jgi:hypothetical protein
MKCPKCGREIESKPDPGITITADSMMLRGFLIVNMMCLVAFWVIDGLARLFKWNIWVTQGAALNWGSVAVLILAIVSGIVLFVGVRKKAKWTTVVLK